MAVGSVVPYAQAGVGAIATQSYANTRHGPTALAMLRRGLAPKDVVRSLTSKDRLASQRQVGLVDARGRAASFTGDDCFEWAGDLVRRNFAVQGNILSGKEVIEGMARAFESTEGDLPTRLLAALAAGQREGGDRRGQQSACLLVVRRRGGYAGMNNFEMKLRRDGKVWGSVYRVFQAQIEAQSR